MIAIRENAAGFCLSIAVVVLLLGCGRAALVQRLAASEAAYWSAKNAVVNRQYETAGQRLDIAIQAGGLSPDLLADAFAIRAVCHAHRGALEEARRDLQMASRGASPDLLLSAQSFVLRRQGKTAEADSTWHAAQSMNPTVQQFQE